MLWLLYIYLQYSAKYSIFINSYVNREARVTCFAPLSDQLAPETCHLLASRRRRTPFLSFQARARVPRVSLKAKKMDWCPFFDDYTKIATACYQQATAAHRHQRLPPTPNGDQRHSVGRWACKRLVHGRKVRHSLRLAMWLQTRND